MKEVHGELLSLEVLDSWCTSNLDFKNYKTQRYVLRSSLNLMNPGGAGKRDGVKANFDSSLFINKFGLDLA